jgi:inner membrane protein
VYANITGYWASDRTSADGKYSIIGNEGNEFIVSDGKGIYKTGEQIITSKVNTEVREVAKTEIKSISFDDEEAIASLEELQIAYPGAEIYLNGELTIDFPEDVKIPVESNQMVTAEVVGSSLKLNYCGLGNAIALLREQYVIGTVEVKIVRQS